MGGRSVRPRQSSRTGPGIVAAADSAPWTHPTTRKARGQHFIGHPALEDHLEYVGGAGDRSRTGYLNLGKVALYQVSYARSAETNDSRSRPRPPPEAPPRPPPTALAANTLRRAGSRARRRSSTR